MRLLRGMKTDEKKTLQKQIKGDSAAKLKGFAPDQNLANIMKIFNVPASDEAEDKRWRRVQRFIELFQEATKLSEQIRQYFENHDEGWTAAQYLPGPDYATNLTFSVDWLEALNKRLNEVCGELCKITSRYRSHPMVHPALLVVASPVVGERWITAHDDDRMEHAAIAQLLKNEGRWIHRCRRCLHCNRWFFASTEHQKHCEDKCRKGHHASSEEFKTKRAAYMRKLRKTERDKKEEEDEKLKKLGMTRFSRKSGQKRRHPAKLKRLSK